LIFPPFFVATKQTFCSYSPPGCETLSYPSMGLPVYFVFPLLPSPEMQQRLKRPPLSDPSDLCCSRTIKSRAVSNLASAAVAVPPPPFTLLSLKRCRLYPFFASFCETWFLQLALSPSKSQSFSPPSLSWESVRSISIFRLAPSAFAKTGGLTVWPFSLSFALSSSGAHVFFSSL